MAADGNSRRPAPARRQGDRDSASRIGAVKPCRTGRSCRRRAVSDPLHLRLRRRSADGVLTLDDVFDTQTSSTVPRTLRGGQAAEHVAVVTLDVTPAGLVPVARATQRIDRRRAVAGAGRSASVPHMSILAAIPPSSFAGLAVRSCHGCRRRLSVAPSRLRCQAFGEQMGNHNTAVLRGPLWRCSPKRDACKR